MAPTVESQPEAAADRVVLPGLHPGQREVAESGARFRVLAAGRRWGKTSLGVALCLREALAGGRAWWVAPSYPLAEVGWRAAKHLARQVPGIAIAEVDRRIICAAGGGEIQVKSADNPDSLRGAGLSGVVLDESAYAHEEAWTEALRPSLSDRQGWALFISTPAGFNWFHALYEAAGHLEGWARWQRPTWDNPRIAADEVALARGQLSEAVFRQEFAAEFLDIGTVRPFRPEWMLTWGAAGEAPLPEGLIIEAGFDPAISKRDGAAYSAVVVAGQCRDHTPNRGRIYILHAERGHWSVYEQVSALLRIVRAYLVRTVRIEDVAYQRALGDVLDREARTSGLTIHVELVKPDADKVRRANAWALLVEQGMVLLGPGQEALRASMLAVPHDESQWDLVDAAGICIRGFPAMIPESERLPGMEISTPAVAQSYATRQPGASLASAIWGAAPGKPSARRAGGYAVRQPVGLRRGSR